MPEMPDLPYIQKQLREMSNHLNEMATILEDDIDDSPLAFFEACEDLQLKVTQLMRATFLAVQHKAILEL